ncbi:MarR family transcriptional regulator [Psychromicrobium sp. YIM B11713]|uniref:MarR family transcriptional regulator n=1 Tax=Psychromicrobium sp. YIM B11713 TaxID=3145233 RepID=UPI00374FB82B
MFVMTIDQRGSRRSEDLIPGLVKELEGVSTLLPFERSVGDELQGVLPSAQDVVEVSMRALRAGQWYIGIGVGAVQTPVFQHSRDAKGSAFIAAREAVEQAKKSGNRVPLAVCGAIPSKQIAAAEAVLRLLGGLVSGRSAAEWRILDRLTPGVRGNQAEVAAALQVSPQAVSNAVRRSGWLEEWAGRDAAALLLELADRTVEEWS